MGSTTFSVSPLSLNMPAKLQGSIVSLLTVTIVVGAQLSQYSDNLNSDSGADGGLEVNIPGVPGEDYPIYANVPDTGFTCDGLVEGGYYADPNAECQAFHFCAIGGLTLTVHQQRVCVERMTKMPLRLLLQL